MLGDAAGSQAACDWNDIKAPCLGFEGVRNNCRRSSSSSLAAPSFIHSFLLSHRRLRGPAFHVFGLPRRRAGGLPVQPVARG